MELCLFVPDKHSLDGRDTRLVLMSAICIGRAVREAHVDMVCLLVRRN